MILYNEMKMDSEPTAIDAHVGARVRLRRTLLKISQEKLGEFLGVSFQQVQKYEKGLNRIGSGQLFIIAKLLKVEPNYFFEGVAALGGAPSMAEPGAEYIHNDAAAIDAVALNRAFARIKNPALQRRIIDLVASIADTEA